MKRSGMKKIGLLFGSVILFIFLWLLITGFSERTDVFLAEYTPSPDGSSITLHVGIGSSMGFTRGFHDDGGGVKPHYLTFYSAYGGFNSALGAKNVFVLPIDPKDTEIYFNRADGGYQLVLQKNSATGEWERP